ncbi:hypothetical protein Mapa_012980 [Marchantia paleacea]|nr:hypothetical protein Mapa_012980 [Marchantia paleacea]
MYLKPRVTFLATRKAEEQPLLRFKSTELRKSFKFKRITHNYLHFSNSAHLASTTDCKFGQKTDPPKKHPSMGNGHTVNTGTFHHRRALTVQLLRSSLRVFVSLSSPVVKVLTSASLTAYGLNTLPLK